MNNKYIALKRDVPLSAEQSTTMTIQKTNPLHSNPNQEVKKKRKSKKYERSQVSTQKGT
jgi:hypothetical protein